MTAFVPRREFLARSLASGAAAAAVSAAPRLAEAVPPATAQRQYYELGLYQMTAGEMVSKADDYFQHALIPAVRRAGVGPAGVFIDSSKAEAPVIYTLIPHTGLESVAALRTALANDAEYHKAGAAFLAASPKSPAYLNHEARLMVAAQFMPALENPRGLAPFAESAEQKVPVPLGASKPNASRIFELRRYRNPSEAAFRKKLEMFGTSELAIFRRVGLNPVFFGEMLFGPDMFNITYMLAFPDAAAKGKAWGEFRNDAAWQKLRATPGYTDPEIIANIKSLILTPTAYSQI